MIGLGRARRVVTASSAIVAILVAVTVATRAPEALREALWADEVASARVITVERDRTALTWIRRESSPPGWFFLGRVVHRLGVSSMEAIRLLSVVFSAGLTALVFVYARRLLTVWGAALAALLVAVGYQFVLHGKELRAYALLAFAAAAFPLVLEAAVARASGRRLAALAVLTAVGAMTHYFFLFVVLTGLVWLWLLARTESRLRITAGIAAGLIPLAAWLPITLFQAGNVNRYFPPFRSGWVIDLYSNLFASGRAWSDLGTVGRLTVLVLVLVGALALARRAEGRLCALLAVVPVAVTALIWALGLHIFTTRNLIVVGPFAAIAIAAAVTSLVPKPAVAVLTVALVGLVAWTYWVDRTLGRTPYDDVSEALVELGWTRADPIVLFAPYPQSIPIGWYLPDHPRLALAEPGAEECRALYVVAANRGGHDWLASNEDAVRTRLEFPSYGFRLEGSRRSLGVVVAHVWSGGRLSGAVADGGLPFRPLNRLPACLAPWTRRAGD